MKLGGLLITSQQVSLFTAIIVGLPASSRPAVFTITLTSRRKHVVAFLFESLRSGCLSSSLKKAVAFSLCSTLDLMNISSVNGFTMQTEKRVTEIRRDAFSVDSVHWRYIRRDRQGKILNSFSILESTAQIALQKALQLQHDRPDLVRVEIEKLRAGTSFNYPVLVVWHVKLLRCYLRRQNAWGLQSWNRLLSSFSPLWWKKEASVSIRRMQRSHCS